MVDKSPKNDPSPTSGRTWTKRRKNDAIFVLVRFGLVLLRIIPNGWLPSVGRLLGKFAHVIFPKARRLAHAQVALALGLDKADAQALIRENFRCLGETLGRTLALFGGFDDGRPQIGPTGLNVLREAAAQGRGVILVSAHFGAFEHLGGAVVRAGFPLTVVARKSYDPRLEALLHVPLRASRNVSALDRDDPATLRALIRILKRGECVGILCDLSTRGRSISTKFFGQEVPSVAAPAWLAVQTKAPIVATFDTGDEVVVEHITLGKLNPNLGDKDTKIAAISQNIQDAIEAQIRKRPTDWIWMHPRFAIPADESLERH